MKTPKTKTEEWVGEVIKLLQKLFVKGRKCDRHEPDICNGCEKRRQVIDFIRKVRNEAYKEGIKKGEDDQREYGRMAYGIQNSKVH